MKKHTIRAFTLIEMLVVIAIIAILTGIVITNLTSSRAKARDAKRISDISQIQLALELYFDRCRSYPSTNDGIIDNHTRDQLSILCPTGITLGSYISAIPQSPAGGSILAGSYNYYVNPENTDFVLHAKLESYNDALKNGLSDSSKPDWAKDLVICYSASSNDYCMSSK